MYYQQFAQANPNSNLAKIVTEYMNVLQSNDFKINDSMEDFYRGLHGRLNVSNLTNHGNVRSGGGSNTLNISLKRLIVSLFIFLYFLLKNFLKIR